jgi:hypothetical protein
MVVVCDTCSGPGDGRGGLSCLAWTTVACYCFFIVTSNLRRLDFEGVSIFGSARGSAIKIKRGIAIN